MARRSSTLLVAVILSASVAFVFLLTVVMTSAKASLRSKAAAPGGAAGKGWLIGGDGERAVAANAGGCSMPGTKASSTGTCSGGHGLDPILEASYNAQNIIKQSILLEDHLNQPAKRCGNCCRKHFLAMSALSEEAVSLADNDDDKTTFQEAAHFYDTLCARWKEGMPPTDVAAELRAVRNDMMKKYP